MDEEAKKRWSLQGMTALVTGGTKGIGHATVEELSAFGASVHTCARNEAELQQCLHEWRESGFNVSGSVCDVSVREAREKLMEEVATLFQGKLNIFINNVGTEIGKPTISVTAGDFALVMTTNFESAYHLSQLAYPLLKESGQGNIVFISSVAGLLSFGGGSVYSATKGALNQLTKNLACEWAKDNIRTNFVAPWIIKTTMPALTQLLANKDLEEALISRTPLQRFGETKEVSSLVVFLCLPAASYITGQVIAIDGGVSVNAFYYKPSKSTDSL
ncbi:tropinone reductase homolog At5g06060-like [Magnolia sinica]|uniref:tropinone reductase homolog At5g06060-like n=1 Tax=Magnolia sinica TaxID=86752 RepID=UPI0026591292|nr:tropinone reductase homolog At5g06060-like [Magnolia sinica]